MKKNFRYFEGIFFKARNFSLECLKSAWYTLNVGFSSYPTVVFICQTMIRQLSRGYTVDFCCDFTRDFFFLPMKKSNLAMKNVLVLCILLATFFGDTLLHILRKEKIESKNRPCSRGFRIVFKKNHLKITDIYLHVIFDISMRKFEHCVN